MPRIEFKNKQSEPKAAIVVSFDLSGFSDFCNRHDAGITLPRFISNFFDELNRFFMGTFQWLLATTKSGAGKLTAPDFINTPATVRS